MIEYLQPKYIRTILPENQFNLVVIMLISIPISYILKHLTQLYLQIAIHSLLTIIFQSILFPQEKYFLWGQQQIVYLLLIYAPRKYVGHAVLFESFSILLLLHLDRYWSAYGQNAVDITGIFMMQLFNWVGLAYNYQIGILEDKELTARQLLYRIKERPSYLSYFGYVNFMPACLVGPVFQYMDYHHYVHRTGDYKDIPDTLIPTLKEIVLFLFIFAIYSLTFSFTIDTILSMQFQTYSYGYKLFYIVISNLNKELKYITAWSLGMSSMRATGICYNPSKNIVQNNKVQYNHSKIEANAIIDFFFTPSMKIKVQSWNKSLQIALRHYIYEQVYQPSNFQNEQQRKRFQLKSQIYTMLVSAFWHGVYLGYYFSFFHWMIYIQITQQVYKMRTIESSPLHKYNLKYPLIFNRTQNFISFVSICYFSTAFHLMTWPNLLQFFKTTYFLPYILLYVGYYLIVIRKTKEAQKCKQ